MYRHDVTSRKAGIVIVSLGVVMAAVLVMTIDWAQRAATVAPVFAQGDECALDNRPAVVFSLEPNTSTVRRVSIFQVTIKVDPKGCPVSGAQTFLTFDHDLLQVVDSAGNATGQIQPGGDLPSVLLNSADNSSGEIGYAAGQLGEPFPRDSLEMATIVFRALNETPGTDIQFSTEGPTGGTFSDFSGDRLAGELLTASVVITAGTPSTVGDGDDDDNGGVSAIQPTLTPTPGPPSEDTTPTPEPVVEAAVTPTPVPEPTATQVPATATATPEGVVGGAGAPTPAATATPEPLAAISPTDTPEPAQPPPQELPPDQPTGGTPWWVWALVGLGGAAAIGGGAIYYLRLRSAGV